MLQGTTGTRQTCLSNSLPWTLTLITSSCHENHHVTCTCWIITNRKKKKNFSTHLSCYPGHCTRHEKSRSKTKRSQASRTTTASIMHHVHILQNDSRGTRSFAAQNALPCLPIPRSHAKSSPPPSTWLADRAVLFQVITENSRYCTCWW